MSSLSLCALDVALGRLLALIPAPVTPQGLPVAQAVGCVLAEPLRATHPVPRTAVARQEGWAVAAVDTQGAGAYSPALLPLPPRRLPAGEALPPGTDAIMPPFDLLMEGPYAQALQPVAPGEGVGQPGSEIAAGTLLREAGEYLTPLDLPALAALGIAEVPVRVPRLGWIEVGDAAACDPLRAVFSTLATREGAALAALPLVGDDAAAALLDAAASHDLVILVGGTGEGPADRAAAALAAAGSVLAHGIGMRPGTTAGVGAVLGRPVVLLPHQPEDALAAWFTLVRPAMAALSGQRPTPPTTARLCRKLASMVGMAELVPLRLGPDGGAEPLAVGAWPLAALSAATALLMVPPASEGYEAGTEILIQPV